MSKGKSITLLIIVSVVIAVLAVTTFVTIPNLGDAGVYYFPSTMERINEDVLGDDFNEGSVYVLSLNEDISDEDSGLVIKDVTDELTERFELLGYTDVNIYAIRSSENESF